MHIWLPHRPLKVSLRHIVRIGLNDDTDNDSCILDFLQQILTGGSVDQIHWIAHAFTKQLAFKRPQSVIPIAKKDEDQMIPSSLLEALIEALKPLIHTNTISFGCYLMLLIVNASITATDSLDLKHVLTERGISLQSCRQYLEEEMNALLKPMEVRERDLRAWQWSICSCLGVYCEIACSSILQVLAYVRFSFLFHG